MFEGGIYTRRPAVTSPQPSPLQGTGLRQGFAVHSGIDVQASTAGVDVSTSFRIGGLVASLVALGLLVAVDRYVDLD